MSPAEEGSLCLVSQSRRDVYDVDTGCMMCDDDPVLGQLVGNLTPPHHTLCIMTHRTSLA